MATETSPADGQPNPCAAPPVHHDWHSTEYVRDWVARYESGAVSRRAEFDLLADLIPRPSGAPIRVLDLGAGWGPVTRHLLGRFPEARAVLLDFSEPMLAEARVRLAGVAGRVAFVRGDLSREGALERAVAAGDPAGAPFDAVCSSSCVHNLRPAERIPALYREIREAVAPGGCFLNLDLMGSASPLVQEAWHRAGVERLRRQRLAESGTLPSREEAEALLLAQGEGRYGGGRGGPRPALRAGQQASQPGPGPGGAGSAGGGLTGTLLDHLLWLQEAGFDAVECFWRRDRRALIGGYRR